MPPKKCGSCEKTVYPVEEFKCLDKIWHKSCFKCAVCNMTLNMKNYKGYNKIPYCNAHYPETKFTAVADTPEAKRLAQNSKIQSQVKYHEDFEKAKGQYTAVADDPETMRVKKNMQTISNVAYHGVLENKESMENTRPNEYEPSYDPYRNPPHQAPPTNYNPTSRSNPQPGYQPEMRQPPQQHTDQRSSGYGQRTSGYDQRSSSGYDQRSQGYDQRSSGGYDRSSGGYQQSGSSMYTPMPGLAQQQPPRQAYPSQPQVPQASLQMRMQPPQQARQPPQSNMQPQMHQPPQHQMQPQHQVHQPPQHHMQPQMQRGPPMNQQPMRAAQPTVPRDPYAGKGKVSKAIYDYTAADADEVSFAEDDLIIKCEPIDDGWMMGTVERTGQHGMLPSNYVENANW